MDRDPTKGVVPGQLSLFAASDERETAQAGPVRRVLLDARLIDYRFIRSRRRTIAITVDAAGLSVRAPLRAPLREVEAFLSQQRRWVLARLEEWAGVPLPALLRGVAGERLPLVGRMVRLDVSHGPRRVTHTGDVLCVSVPAPERRDRVLAQLRTWLRAEARVVLQPRVAHFAERLGVSPRALELSSARLQWGSCTARGVIRLNWRLVHVEPELADYVVAHEVAHMVELNHSRRFWDLLATLYPDWRAARERLERAGASLPLIRG